ncbi:MAG: hypothetical protein HON90_17120 [Halobacteriovoraceae bacterium]|nr:hypothetical protein [Halobacteriovoraceae bacterium]
MVSNQKGQTLVEYILLITVVVTVTVSLFHKLDEYLISNPDSFQNQYINSYRSTFQGQNGGFSGQYQYFTVRR